MSIIADLIRAGVDPELVARVADELDGARPKSSGAIRQQRYRERNKERNALRNEKGSSFPLDPPPQTPPPIIPQTPPKTKPTLRSGLERARARTRIDVTPIAFDMDFPRQAGLDDRRIEAEFAQFYDHHLKLGSLMADWHAAWRTWVRNAIKFQPRAGPAGRSNGVRGFLENVAQMMADGTNSRTENVNGSSHQAVLSFPERRG